MEHGEFRTQAFFCLIILPQGTFLTSFLQSDDLAFRSTCTSCAGVDRRHLSSTTALICAYLALFEARPWEAPLSPRHTHLRCMRRGVSFTLRPPASCRPTACSSAGERCLSKHGTLARGTRSVFNAFGKITRRKSPTVSLPFMRAVETVGDTCRAGFTASVLRGAGANCPAGC